MIDAVSDADRFAAVCSAWRLLPRADGLDPVLDTVLADDGSPLRDHLKLGDLPVCRVRLDCGMAASRRAGAVVTLHADLTSRASVGMVWATRERGAPVRDGDGELVGPVGHMASLSLAWSFTRDDVAAERPRTRVLVLVGDEPQAPLSSLRVARAEAARARGVDPDRVRVGWTSWARIGAAVDVAWRRRREALVERPALRLLYDARGVLDASGVRADGSDRSWPVPPRDLPDLLDVLLPIGAPDALPDWPPLESR